MGSDVDPQEIPEVDKSSRFEQYRAFVGPAEYYDVFSAIQFNLLTSLGLRDHHYLLDIGCGSLRGGRLFIPYLRPGRYYGIEPVQILVAEGLKYEIGESIVEIKRPQFSSDANFTLSVFDRKFDYLLAQSIFSHASQAQIRRCLAEARKVMKPDSVFAATFFEGPENYEGNHWVVKATYTMERMKELTEEQGLVCEPLDWSHPDLQKWLLIFRPEGKRAIIRAENGANALRLEDELKFCKDKLWRIENHPYVRVGMRVYHVIKMAQFGLRRVALALQRTARLGRR